MSNYTELLTDPEWREKRNYIVMKAGNKCQECGATGELNVHHTWYQSNKLPWEYPDYCFKCLCPPCHHRQEVLEVAIKQEIARMPYNDARLLFNVILAYRKGLSHGK